MNYLVGTAGSAPEFSSGCQRLVPLGSEMHEVRWLPTIADEHFTSTSDSIRQGCGSIIIGIIGGDGVAVSDTLVQLNGYMEYITVFEWVSGNRGQVTNAIEAPTGFSSQQVLATIGDMGAYIFRGERVRAAVDGVIAAGFMGASMALTAGVRSRVTRANAMPRIELR